jgi:hypothetical protein
MILLGLLVGLAEMLFRTNVFESHFIATRRTGRHRQFELQLGRLDSIVAREGSINCIFLGNSMVWRGFDPEAFARGYEKRVGQGMRCFNFGVDGMPVVTAGALARILVKDYHPNLLIYGTDARDYAIPRVSEDATVLLDSPWLRYRLGQFSVQGWVQEHSYLYRYQATLSQVLRFQNRYLFLTASYASNKDNYGFGGDARSKLNVTLPPDQQRDAGQVQHYFALLSDYRMLPENLSGLEQLLDQKGADLQVLIVEMPVPPTYLDFFSRGEQDYRRFIDQVNQMARVKAVQFWPTTQLWLIPEDGWVDYSHLNTTGARIFSNWLGEQLGSAVVQGQIGNPFTGHNVDIRSAGSR